VAPGTLIVMGRVLGPFGVKGWVRVKTYTESPEILAARQGWWIGKDGDWREQAVAQTQRHGARLVARFEGCDSPQAALAYRELEVALLRESLPPTRENEFYQADLIGLEVRNMDDEWLGTLAELFSNGAHEVMRVSDGKVERLLPFIDQVVHEVDMGAGRITVDWGMDW